MQLSLYQTRTPPVPSLSSQATPAQEGGSRQGRREKGVPHPLKRRKMAPDRRSQPRAPSANIGQTGSGGAGVEPTEVHRAKSTLKENFSNYYLALGPKSVISNTYSRMMTACKRSPSCPRQESQDSTRGYYDWNDCSTPSTVVL